MLFGTVSPSLMLTYYDPNVLYVLPFTLVRTSNSVKWQYLFGWDLNQERVIAVLGRGGLEVRASDSKYSVHYRWWGSKPLSWRCLDSTF